MWRKFCKFLLKSLGWKVSHDTPVPEDKCIILGVPHTSIWDFAISYLYYQSIGGDAKCMIKKEMFVWPLGWLLKKLGSVPIDRKSGAAVTKQMIGIFNSSEKFHLALAPEGTREPVKRWKLGFHTIAKATGVPVYLGYFDWGRKIIGRGERFELTEDAMADLREIQKIYKAMNLKGLHDGCFDFMEGV
jgi:1-acyl-sn-glycerol-3-phosphate acyltransferase